jgi:hypothetical protein
MVAMTVFLSSRKKRASPILNSISVQKSYNNCLIRNCSMYQETIPVPPGVGLAGFLWSDVEHFLMARRNSHSTTNKLVAAVAHVLNRSRNRGGDSHHGGRVNNSRLLDTLLIHDTAEQHRFKVF